MANKTVLIHEKDDKFLKALKLYFRGSEWDPETADTGPALAAAARKRRPNVVLVAIENDNGEARDMLRLLGSDDATRGVPVVVMSTRKSDRDLFAEGIAGVGAASFIKKPFIKKAIVQLLDEVAAGGGGAARPARSGVDMGSVFSEIDTQIDEFFEKDGGKPEEFTIALDDDTTATPESEPIAIQLDEDAPAEARPAAPAPVAAVPEPEPVEVKGKEEIPADVVAELRRLRDRVKELEKELREKTEEFRSAAREKERIEHSVGKKESELIEKIKGLEKENEDLQEESKKRKQALATQTALVQQLNEDLETKDAKHVKEVEEWRGQIGRIQGQLDEMQEKSSGQAHQIEDKNDEISRLNRRIEDGEGERRELNANLERMTEAKGAADRDIESLRADLASTRDTLARTESDLATERSRVAAARASFESGLGALRDGLERDHAAARQAIEQGLAQARESAERAAQAARDTLDKGLAALTG